jgi:hypothetical protein
MEENSFLSKLKKAWENPKGKAAIKLGGYLLVIIAISIIAAIGSRMNSDDSDVKEEVKTLTYSDKVKFIEDNNYAYVFDLTKGDEKIVFRGVKFLKRELGYKETEAKTLKYYIDDQTYEVVLGELNPVDDLYNDTNHELIDMVYIIDTVKNMDGELKETSYEKYYLYDDILNNIKTSVYFNDEKITKIVITDNETTAVLTFDKFGEITEKDLSF